jgi:arginine decarboxylase
MKKDLNVCLTLLSHACRLGSKSFFLYLGGIGLSKQAKAPLFEEMLRHKRVARGNFHVPGHKQGRLFDNQAKSYFGAALELDLTEVGELDDLHHPSGVIQQAEELAAELFGADKTFFLVGGTTAGNIATILSLCRPGDQLIIQRTSHQSIFHGCLLADVQPIYLRGEIDPMTGLELPLKPEQLKQVLRAYPNAKGVFLTSPSYFGVVQPLSSIKEICDSFGVPLLVDEAHGAHFTFHSDLPPSALESGADVAVQSTHKMLTSLTMSSMLHLRGKRVDYREIARWLRVIESSSPSYLLMASLDLARRDMALNGKNYIEVTLNMLDQFRRKLASLSNLTEVRLLGSHDPFKLLLRTKKRTMSGFEIAEWMVGQNIYPELADHEKVLFVFSIGNKEEDSEILFAKLKELDQSIQKLERNQIKWPSVYPQIPEFQQVQMDLRRRRQKLVPLIQAVGQKAAEMIVPYPPGIPLILPGESFTEEMVDYLLQVNQLGGKIRGISSSFAPSVYVVE